MDDLNNEGSARHQETSRGSADSERWEHHTQPPCEAGTDAERNETHSNVWLTFTCVVSGAEVSGSEGGQHCQFS
jgi:hypothetical protein